MIVHQNPPFSQQEQDCWAVKYSTGGSGNLEANGRHGVSFTEKAGPSLSALLNSFQKPTFYEGGMASYVG